MALFRLVSQLVRLMTIVKYSFKPFIRTYRVSGLTVGVVGLICYLIGRSHQPSFPSTLFNLSESERQQVWKGYLDAEMRAAREAVDAFPVLSPLSVEESSSFQEQDQKRQELRLELKEKYTQAVLADHGLSYSQFAEIEVESRLKRWNAPIEVA